MARQIAAVLDEERRVGIEIFVIAIGEAGRVATPSITTDSVETCGPSRYSSTITRSVGEWLRASMKALVRSFDLRDALHAARAAAVDRLDDKIASALDGDALQLLRCATSENQGTARRARAKRRFIASLSQASSAVCDGDSGKTKLLRDRGRRDRRVGGDADHAIDLADFAVEAFGGGGRFVGAIDIGDQAGIGKRKSGRLWIAVGDDDSTGPFPWRAWRHRPLRSRRTR